MSTAEERRQPRTGRGAAAAFGILSLAALMALAGQRALPANPTAPASAGAAAELAASRHLTGSILYRSPELALPAALAVVGDRLVVGDNYADRSLRVLRRSDGSVERTFGRKGRGPREFETILSLDALDSAGRLLAYDPTLQRVTWIDLETDFDGDRWVADRSVTLRAPAMVLATAWADDGFMGVGAFTDARLARLTPSGRLVRTTGAAPVVPETVTPQAWTRAYQSRLKARPDGRRLAVAARFADRVEIYDGEGRLTAVGDRTFGFEPDDLRTEDPGAVRFGYLDLAVTDSRIYALFSGRTRDEGDAFLGDRIHVFDWDGRLVDVWALDARLMAIAITPDGTRLYGARHDPEPAVVLYTPRGQAELAQAG